MNRLAQLEAFLVESPNDPFLKYAIALEQLKMGKEKEALVIFVKLTETNPNYVGTYYHLGKLQEQLEQLEAALVSYQKGMEVAQKLGDSHSYNELQGVYNMLQDEMMDY